jgi:uncharacterized protein YdeI (YjbR/CyaY-like superfamily)
MGSDCHILGVLKEIRERIGKGIGDDINVVVEEDTEPREVSLPADLAEALAGQPEADTHFKKLSYSHQREYVQWIEDARRPQARHDRIAKTIEMLEKGKKRR